MSIIPLELSAGFTASTQAVAPHVKCDIELDGDTVQDVIQLLHRVCNEMDGMVGPSHVLHQSSIRCADISIVCAEHAQCRAHAVLCANQCPPS
jgi:hypothetical protein